MTVPSSEERNDYTGDGSTATYAYSFRITDDDHLLVTVADEDGAETTLTKTTDYTVTGVGVKTGGNIVLVDDSQAWIDDDGYLSEDYILSVRHYVPLAQAYDIRNLGAFYPETHEDAIDYLMWVCKQQQDEIDRCLKVGETSSVAVTLPTPVDGYAPIWDGTDGSMTNAPVDIDAINDAVAAAEAAQTAAELAETNAETAEANAETAETNAEAAQVAAEAARDIILAALPAGLGPLPWPAAVAPTGWLLCQGAAVSRTTYASLFAVIGTTFGAGDGSTTFNVPDMQERIPVGYKSGSAEFGTLGGAYGAKTTTLTAAQSGVPAHTHSYAGGYTDASSEPVGIDRSSNTGAGGSVEANTPADAAEAHSNCQLSRTVNFIIKY